MGASPKPTSDISCGLSESGPEPSLSVKSTAMDEDGEQKQLFVSVGSAPGFGQSEF